MIWPFSDFIDLAAKENGSFVDGPFGSNLKTSAYVEEGVPIIRIQNVRPNRFLSKDIKYISFEKAEELRRHNYKPGDLIITKLGDPCGVACIVPESAGEGIVVADVIRFRGDKKKIDHQFLSYFINSYEGQKQIAKKAKGTTRQRVNLSNFKELKIPLPPLSEQKRIAAILDKADALREKRRRAIAKLDELLQSVFMDMFGNPIKNTKSFPIKKLNEIALIERGRFSPRPRNNPIYYDGKYDFIQTGDISSSKYILADSHQTLNDRGIKVSKSFPAGYIVIAIVGATIGETALLNKEVYCPDSIIGINVRSKFGVNEYVEHVLRFWKPIFIAKAPETARANINLSTLKPLPIPLPPLEEQKKFAAIFWKIYELQQKFSLQKDTLFSSLQHRAFKGEL